MYRNLNGRKMAFLPKFKQTLNSYERFNHLDWICAKNFNVEREEFQR